MGRLSGARTTKVLRGIRPSGRSAFSALPLLSERKEIDLPKGEIETRPGAVSCPQAGTSPRQ